MKGKVLATEFFTDRNGERWIAIPGFDYLELEDDWTVRDLKCRLEAKVGPFNGPFVLEKSRWIYPPGKGR